jgi:hypothetical protein
MMNTFDSISDDSLRLLFELALKRDILLLELAKGEDESSKMEQVRIIDEQNRNTRFKIQSELLREKERFNHICAVKEDFCKGKTRKEILGAEQKSILQENEARHGYFLSMKALMDNPHSKYKQTPPEVLYLAFEVLYHSNMRINEANFETIHEKIQTLIDLSELRDTLAMKNHLNSSRRAPIECGE